MRICGLCRRRPRPNDPMGSLDVPPDHDLVAAAGVEPGSYQACGECVARFDPARPYRAGLPGPPRFVYGPHGDPLAESTNGLYCGLCRRYAREGARMGHLGLYYDAFQAPVPDPLEPSKDMEEGVYSVCPDCLAARRPAVYARWKAAGLIPAGLPPAAFTFEALH